MELLGDNKFLTYVDSPVSTIKLHRQRNKMRTYVRALIE